MPEGDTVFRTAAALRVVLEGKLLVHSSFRTPSLATADLSGWRVSSARSRGKHLLIDVVEPATGRCHSIHSHLKMEGGWDVYPVGARWRRPAHQVRVVLTTATHQAVGFSLGILELISDADAALSYLGPDLLGADWDPGQAIARIVAQPDRPIGLALLDQRLLAGIGNEYRNELCFLTGVLPSRPVRDTDVGAVVDLAHRMLTANKTRPIRTTTGNTARNARLWVYGRGGQPCRRCSTLIRRGMSGGSARHPGAVDGRRGVASTLADQERVVYWCPQCQS